MIILKASCSASRLFSTWRCEQPRSSVGNLPNPLPAHRRSFAPEWQRNVADAEKQATHTLEQSERCYNAHARNLPDIQLGSNVVLQNPRTKLWDIHGTVVHISPYRRYSIKTQGGRVLVRNRRFLRRRTPASLDASERNPHQLDVSLPHKEPNSTGRNRHEPSQDQTADMRRSDRPHRPPQRLIEDPTWH